MDNYIDDRKYDELGNIIHHLGNCICCSHRFFTIPESHFNNWCARKIEKDYKLEEVLIKLGLQIEYLDNEENEEIEKLISDSKEADVKVIVNWEQLNLENLKEFLLPAEKWEIVSKAIRDEAIYVWTYAYMTITGIIDIESRGCFPSRILSNLYPAEFEFENVKMNSMEGFLQSLKTPDEILQKEIQLLSGKEAKKAGGLMSQFDGKNLYWQGKIIDRYSDEYQQLLRRCFRAKWEQNETFRDALVSTKGKDLIHSIGKQNKEETILTEEEYITLLKELREL